ncbi:MAG: hypothetical protein AUG89_06595 [Acidobacteria bacterium 13_1_20CM_4_56_7]|jgi:hypothetical protein|nr:MAG: hypothetical protein AUG89_06595 [Acidobacteria bacterium 13_1_20CM_4_56_7]
MREAEDEGKYLLKSLPGRSFHSALTPQLLLMTKPTMPVLPTNPLSLVCEFCGAGAGHDCKTHAGGHLGVLHVVRIKAAASKNTKREERKRHSTVDDAPADISDLISGYEKESREAEAKVSDARKKQTRELSEPKQRA